MKKLRRESRSLSRKQKGSNRWEKQKKRVGRVYLKVKNTRKDFHHKLSTSFNEEFGFMAGEDLKVQNMIKFGNLSRHISDVGWGQFVHMLEYKSEWYGNTFVKVDPKCSSITCNNCNKVDKNSRKSQSKFECTGCAHRQHADTGAANEVLKRGLGKANIRQREPVGCA